MTDLTQFRRLVIIPALHHMGLWSLPAEQLLAGTALVESGLEYLTQHGDGPARGFYQIEPNTAQDLYDNYLAFRPEMASKLKRLIVPGQLLPDQLVTNLAFSTAIARLIYYRRPEPLPQAGDIKGLAKYWKAHFNTHLGKGREEDFVRKAGRFIVARLPKPRFHLRPSTPMPSGFAHPTPPQWTAFIKRHPELAGAKPTRVYLSAAKLDQLIQVKREVAAAHPYKRDPGKDVWSVLEGRKPGDCEDIALTILAALAALGWPLGALRLAICRTAAGVGHAVLCVHTDKGVYIVDNRLSHIAPWAGLPYEWIGRWHGGKWVSILPKPQ